MGVGVYTSDFNGSGGTFIVDGLVGGEEEYRKYVMENLPADAMSFETWRDEVCDDPESADEDDYNDYLYELAEEESDSLEVWQTDQDEALIEDIQEAIYKAARSLGMSIEGTDRDGRYTRAGFDDKFVLMASGTYIDIGWRSWEHDIIVGVAGSSLTREWAGDIYGFAGEIIDSTGLAPSTFGEIYGALQDAVQSYVRLTLMQDGKDCAYRTSGYTTSSYQEPDEGFTDALDALHRDITTLVARIPKSFQAGVILAGPSEREEIVKALATGDANSDIPVVLPLYDFDSGEVRLYQTDRRRFVENVELPEAFADAMEAAISENAGSDDFLALPRSEAMVEAWNTLQSSHPDYFVLSAEEWIDAVGGDPAIEWRDSNGDEWEANVLFATPKATVAP